MIWAQGGSIGSIVINGEEITNYNPYKWLKNTEVSLELCHSYLYRRYIKSPPFITMVHPGPNRKKKSTTPGRLGIFYTCQVSATLLGGWMCFTCDFGRRVFFLWRNMAS